MRYLGRIGRLGLGGLIDLIVLSVLALAADVGVRLLPLPRVCPWFGVRLSGDVSPPGPDMTLRERRRQRAVGMITRHWPFVDEEAICLRRALLLGWVFRARDPLLRLGVARIDGQIRAHAWLEFNGGAVGTEGAYEPLRFGDHLP